MFAKMFHLKDHSIQNTATSTLEIDTIFEDWVSQWSLVSSKNESCDSLNYMNFKTTFYFTGTHIRLNNDCAYIQFNLEFIEESPVIMQHNICFIDMNGNKKLKTSIIREYSKENDTFLMLLFHHSALLNDKTLINGTVLKISVEVHVLEEKLLPALVSPNIALSNELEALFEKETLSDITLLVNEKQIKAHKVILASRSLYFANIFDNDFQESRENQLKISNVETEIFELMLRYMYTDKLEKLEIFAPELMVAADYYQVDSLKTVCVEYMCLVVDNQNFCKLFLLSEQYSLLKLKEKCILHFKVNCKEIVKSGDLMKILSSRPEMLITLMKLMADLL